MTITLSRRQAIAGTVAGTLAGSAFGLSGTTPAAAASGAASGLLAELERRRGGRLGVAILNLTTGAMAGHRADERFLMCSTFKTLLAAQVLARVDRKEEALDRRVTYAKDQIVTWSPATEKHVGAQGMTVGQLCEATVTLSDNTAANLLLARSGGPQQLTAFVRTLGDTITRHDRTEPALNEHDGPGDQRDTTTPAAMAATLRRLFLGDALSARSRAQLASWHILNRTGDERLRAGLPPAWLVADKTGTNGSGTAADIGIAWPADRGPVIIAAYYEAPSVAAGTRNAVLAEVGRIAAQV